MNFFSSFIKTGLSIAKGLSVTQNHSQSWIRNGGLVLRGKRGQILSGIAIAATALLSLAGCGETPYEVRLNTEWNLDRALDQPGLGSNDIVSTCDLPGAHLTEEIELKFSAQTRNTNVVFVVDTSGSMDAEMIQVKSKISQFVESIKNQLSTATTRFMLVGSYNEDHDLYLLDSPYERFKTINSVFWNAGYVHSKDKFAKLLWTYGINQFSYGGYSNIQVIDNFAPYNADPSGSIPIQLPELKAGNSCATNGALFNCNAINHIIFVTDDTERLMVPGFAGFELYRFSDFEAADVLDRELKRSLASRGNSFKYHSIAGKNDGSGHPSCAEIVSIGYVYDYLSALTGGLSLDLCANDWTPLFNTLGDQIIKDALAVPAKKCVQKNRSKISAKLKWIDLGGASHNIALNQNQFVYYSPGNISPQAAYSVPLSTLRVLGVPLLPSGIPSVKVNIEVQFEINPK